MVNPNNDAPKHTNGPDEIDLLVDDRPGDRIFRIAPTMLTSEELLEEEYRHIFEKTWIYLGLENDLPETGSFLTSSIGRVPVLVSRGSDGTIQAFHNICRHRGAVVCRTERGKAKLHICPYHHWCYNPDGELVSVKDKSVGSYPDGFFERVGDLKQVTRLESYKGLIFGSLNPDIQPLEEFLGDMRILLDLIMDQSPDGMETIPGRTPYSYRGNWKLQAENAVDLYHLSSTHASMLSIQSKQQGRIKTVRSLDWENRQQANAHVFNFANGHAAYVGDPTEPESLPIFDRLDELTEKYGEEKAQNMLCGLQLHIFPNLQLASSFVPVIRKFNPITTDETEMEVWCLGAVNESADERTTRLRQFEDFFNPTGLATPDDCLVYEFVQRGANADSDYFEGYSRGMTKFQNGPNDRARSLGISPEQSLTFSSKEAPEIPLQAMHREWARAIKEGRTNDRG